MSTLERLALDHDRLRGLLRLFENEFDAFENGGFADLQLMRDIVRHYSEYFNRVHHPLESRMFVYLARAGALSRVDSNGDALIIEHAELTVSTNRLLIRLDQILNDHVVPRTEFIASARRFLALNRKHMADEERTVFAWAGDQLTEENWRDISREYAPSVERRADC